MTAIPLRSGKPQEGRLAEVFRFEGNQVTARLKLKKNGQTMERLFFVLGALSALVGVGAGAFGAHGLKGRLDPEMLSIFETGVRYQMYHAFALIAAAWSQAKWPSRLVTIGGWMFVAGTAVFSGSLYMLSMTAEKWLGMMTPIGGVAFIAGWACLAWAAWKA